MIVHWHASLGSTNDEAMRLALAGAPHGSVVCAREQTAGRGRQGRLWASPSGNLYASFVLRPTAPADRAAEVGFVAAVALAAALDGFMLGSTLKWPNDVLLAGAKLAGILSEANSGAVVVGMGVNLAAAPPGLPYAATSLAAHGVHVTAECMLAALMPLLYQGVAEWQTHGFGPTRAAWLARGPAPGDALQARRGSEMIDGRFAGLADDGALLLDTAGGLLRIVAGEVLGRR